mgnify:CR=1 FL=1
MITNLINLIILLFAPFLVIGVIKKTKAFWTKRCFNLSAVLGFCEIDEKTQRD